MKNRLLLCFTIITLLILSACHAPSPSVGGEGADGAPAASDGSKESGPEGTDASISGKSESGQGAAGQGPSESLSPPDPAEAVPEVVRAVIGKTEEPPPTPEQREEMAQRLGRLGFSVLRDNENMLNYEPVAKFCEDAAAGRDGEVIVFRYPWSYITYMHFVSRGGEITCSYTNYFASKGFEGEEPQGADAFEYTEKGNLIFHIAGNSESSGFRVLPLSEKSREYYKKYVLPGNIFSKGPLDTSWNSKDFSAMNWDWVFEGLWLHETGERMVDINSPYYVKAPDSMSFDSVRLPASVAEGLLQKYFNVPAETLRALDEYDEATDTYSFTGFNGGGYSSTLEVSEWKENPDGSLTLRVDFVSLEFNEELSAQSELTVMPEKGGGFKYLSNVFTAY